MRGCAAAAPQTGEVATLGRAAIGIALGVGATERTIVSRSGCDSVIAARRSRSGVQTPVREVTRADRAPPGWYEIYDTVVDERMIQPVSAGVDMRLLPRRAAYRREECYRRCRSMMVAGRNAPLALRTYGVCATPGVACTRNSRIPATFVRPNEPTE